MFVVRYVKFSGKTEFFKKSVFYNDCGAAVDSNVNCITISTVSTKIGYADYEFVLCFTPSGHVVCGIFKNTEKNCHFSFKAIQK